MRRFALAAIVTLGGFGVAAACGEPYEGEIPLPGEAGVDATTEDGSNEAGVVVPDGGLTEPDAAPPFDATSDSPPVDASCNPCDCDDDGFAHDDAATCPDAGGKPRGDCDDRDLRAHPDAGFLKDLPTVTTKGDWDCNGVVTREITPVNVNCPGGLLANCANLSGFTNDPGCGAQGTFVKCKATTLSCTLDTSEVKTQGCK